MCQDCANVQPELVDAHMQECRTVIKQIIDSTKKLLRTCVSIEDRYRQIGVLYHSTQCSARVSWIESNEHREHFMTLNAAFGLKEPSHYTRAFGNLEILIARLSELRCWAQHVPSTTTLENLKHTVDTRLLPNYKKRLGDVRFMQSQCLDLQNYAIALSHISRARYERSENGLSIAWSDGVFNAISAKQTVRFEGIEWEDFCNWVACLPEAGKAMEAGAQLEDIARRMLWNADETFLPLAINVIG